MIGWNYRLCPMIFITAPTHIMKVPNIVFPIRLALWILIPWVSSEKTGSTRWECKYRVSNIICASVQPRLVLDWAWKVLEMYLAQALFIIRTSAIQRKASDYVRVSIINSPTKVVNRHLGICRWQKKVQWKLNFENSQFQRPNFLETSRWSESSENT